MSVLQNNKIIYFPVSSTFFQSCNLDQVINLVSRRAHRWEGGRGKNGAF